MNAPTASDMDLWHNLTHAREPKPPGKTCFTWKDRETHAHTLARTRHTSSARADGRTSLLHEAEQVVQELFPLGVSVQLVQLQGREERGRA